VIGSTRNSATSAATPGTMSGCRSRSPFLPTGQTSSTPCGACPTRGRSSCATTRSADCTTATLRRGFPTSFSSPRRMRAKSSRARIPSRSCSGATPCLTTGGTSWSAAGCWPTSVAGTPTRSLRSRSRCAPIARARVSRSRCSPRCAPTPRGGASPSCSRRSDPTGKPTSVSRCRLRVPGSRGRPAGRPLAPGAYPGKWPHPEGGSALNGRPGDA
jgi:hypothetical protein